MAQAGALFTTLPTELFDNILDRVSSRHTLAALSCTSRAFARHTCPRLYSRIHLHLIVGDPKKPHFRLEPHLLPSRLTLANATFIEAITVEVDDFKRHDGEGKVMSEPILELFWKIQQCNAMGGGRSRLRSFTWESKICPWEGILECLPYGIRELVFPYQHTLGKVDAPGDGGKCLLGDHATEEDSSSSEETPWHGCRCSFAICKCFIKLQHLAPEVHSLVLKGVRTPPAMEGLGKFLDRAENLVSVAMGTASKCVYHKVEDCSWIACAMRRFSKVKRLEMLGVSGIGDIKALELGVERLERLESLTLEEIFIPRLVMANIIPSIFSALIQSNKRGKGLVLQELKVIITYKTYDEITQFLRAYRGLKRVSLIADYFPEDEPNEGAFLWDLFSALVESHSHSLETFSLASSSEEWACIDEDCMSKFMPNLRKLKVLQQLGLESSIIFNLEQNRGLLRDYIPSTVRALRVMPTKKDHSISDYFERSTFMAELDAILKALPSGETLFVSADGAYEWDFGINEYRNVCAQGRALQDGKIRELSERQTLEERDRWCVFDFQDGMHFLEYGPAIIDPY